MKKCIAALFLLLIGTTLAACSASDKNSKTDMTSIPTSLVSTTPTPTQTPTTTPIPTYAPGTDLYGMLSVTGNIVIEPQYEYLDLFSDEGFARFEDHGLWGFVNEQGEEVIPAQYEYANNFSEGLAAVKMDGLYGFIDTTGEMVIAPKYEGVEGGFKFGRCVIVSGTLKGLIDTGGNVIVEPAYLSILQTSSEYFIVTDLTSSYGTLYGIIDRDGTIVVDFQEQEIYMVTDKGNYFVSREYDPLDNQAIKSDIYDLSGNHYVTRTDSWDFSRPLLDVLFVVASPDGEHWGLLALDEGQFIVEPIYDSISFHDGEESAYLHLDEKAGLYILKTGVIEWDAYSFEYGYVYLEKNGRNYLVDLDGNEILPTQYSVISATPHGTFAVMENDTLYVIDLQGNILFEADDLTISPWSYNQSIDCWEFTYKKNIIRGYDYYYIDGFISGDGSKVDMKCWSDDIVPDAFYEDFVDNPEITGEALVNPVGDPNIIVYFGYYDFPKQGVFVVTDKEDNYGLISSQGEVLFELQACHIFTNKDSGNTTNKYEYDHYNDTDYLIYTVVAK